MIYGRIRKGWPVIRYHERFVCLTDNFIKGSPNGNTNLKAFDDRKCIFMKGFVNNISMKRLVEKMVALKNLQIMKTMVLRKISVTNMVVV